jgi:hypothetical protein
MSLVNGADQLHKILFCHCKYFWNLCCRLLGAEEQKQMLHLSGFCTREEFYSSEEILYLDNEILSPNGKFCLRLRVHISPPNYILLPSTILIAGTNFLPSYKFLRRYKYFTHVKLFNLITEISLFMRINILHPGTKVCT